jgi:co-chaperonin GroES (HSP10)
MMRILGSRVLVALPPKEQEITTDSGLVLVRDPDRKQQTRGVVVALGERRGVVEVDDLISAVNEYCIGMDDILDNRKNWLRDDLSQLVQKRAPAPFDVQIGDVVLFPASAGEVLRVGELDHVLLHESEILCVLEPVQKETAA